MKIKQEQKIALNEKIEDYYFRIEDIEGSFKGTLCIGSGGFYCKRPIFFTEDIIKEFLSNLEKMHKTLSGEASIKEEFEDTFVQFSINTQGHVIISGQAVQHADQSQSLEFEFETDQTELPFLIQTTKDYLEYLKR